MAIISVGYRGPVAVIAMKGGENRFTRGFLEQFLSALDEIENNEEVKAVVTIGEGKYFSNGLDLAGMESYTEEDFKQFERNVRALFKRLLLFPVVTIAALNGHAFAGGGLLALAHDYRVMRKERGWFCLPEVKLLRPFDIGTMEFIKAKIPPSEYTNCILVGKRYTAEQGYRASIVHSVHTGDVLLEKAIELAKVFAKESFDRDTLVQLKNGLYHNALKAITQPYAMYAKL